MSRIGTTNGDPWTVSFRSCASLFDEGTEISEHRKTMRTRPTGQLALHNQRDA